MTPPRMTARDVEGVLWRHYTGRGWIALPEVTYGHTGSGTQRSAGLRRIDMLLLRRPRNVDPNAPVERAAVEIKVDRADFLTDIADRSKQQPWRDLCHHHYYAAPTGVIDPSEVPVGSGLLLIDTAGGVTTVTTALRAPRHALASPDLPSWLVLAIADRASYADGRSRGHLALTPEIQTA